MKLKLDKPIAATFEEWDEWEEDARAEHPVRYWLTETMPMFFRRLWQRIKDAHWWVRHRIDPRHRYHIVRTGLSPGYYDKDFLMIHACFNLLKLYVEREKPFEHLDTTHHPEKWAEIRALYEWWTKTRPSRAELPDPPSWDFKSISDEATHEWAMNANKQEQAWEEEDEAMLIRLVKIRRFLWT